MTRTATTYNEILGRDEHDSVIVLDDVFEYDYGFKGATGTRFEIVSREEVEEAIETENFEDYARELWQMEVAEGITESGLEEWTENYFGTEEEKIEYLYDSSYSHMHPAIREAFNVPEDAVINCIGGGRMFPAALEGLEWLPGKREQFEQVILDAEETKK